MAQRLMSLEDAANQLGISKDRLNQLREAGKVRAYKDGASWKFRGEDIEKFAAEGLPQIEPPPSDINLDLDLGDDELELPSSYEKPTKPAAEAPASDELELGLADEESGAKPETAPSASDVSAAAESDVSLADEESMAGPASDVSVDDVDEPTVEGIDDGSDDALALDEDDAIDLNTDSILMSEAELGDSPGRPPSTIIGKADLDLDADLDLSPLDKGSGSGPVSDVKLASDSDLLPVGDDDLGLDLPSPSGNFEGLEELEVDLEAESSRILAPEDVAKAQAAAKAVASGKKAPASSKKGATSDLQLAPTPSDPHIATSDIGIGKEGASGTGLTGLSALELDDDDQVLGDGSDVTLSGESSGINIISPSDSGLALDEVPLDLSGSAPIGSSLDLGMGSSVVDEDSQLEPLAIDVGPESKIGDFQLTPLGEEEDDEEKDSSQVIALDEISEETAGAPIGAGLSEAGMMTEDFGMGLTPGAAPVGMVAAAGADTQFSLWNVLALGGCIFLLLLCGMMTYDLLRNMWSWGGVATFNHSLLDSVSSVLGK